MNQAKIDSERLMNDLLPFAKKMLTDHGEFHPYGGMMKEDGTIVDVGASTGLGLPKGQLVVDLLIKAFRTEAGKKSIRAAAIVLNVTVEKPGGGDKVDAIEVRLDHIDTYTAHVFFPYAMTADAGLITEPPFATRGRSFAFTPTE